MDIFTQAFEQYSILWLILSGVIGGFIGATIKFPFDHRLICFLSSIEAKVFPLILLISSVFMKPYVWDPNVFHAFLDPIGGIIMTPYGSGFHRMIFRRL